MTYQQDLGQLGESIAKKYLEAKDFKIVLQNYRTRGGEIDLIVTKEQALYFIEVKTRTSQQFGWPEEAVDWRKQEKILRAAQEFLLSNKLEAPWQLVTLAIEIEAETQNYKVRWLET